MSGGASGAALVDGLRFGTAVRGMDVCHRASMTRACALPLVRRGQIQMSYAALQRESVVVLVVPRTGTVRAVAYGLRDRRARTMGHR